MLLKSLFSTKKFWILAVLYTVLLALSGFTFSNEINESLNAIKTWNNCDSTFIAYNSVKRKENCYYYYGQSVPVCLNDGDGILIKADVYQFVYGNVYDSKSLLNQANVVDGNYSELNDAEIAIPKKISERYGLKIGDCLYLNSKNQYKIKFIFRDFYDIKEPSIYSDSNVVFVGGTSVLSENYKYAIFGDPNEMFNEIYTFSNAKRQFINTMLIFTSLTAILTLTLNVAYMMFYLKSQKKSLYNAATSGNIKTYRFSLIGTDTFVTVIPLGLCVVSLFAFNYRLQALIIIGITLLVVGIKEIALQIKIH